MEQTNIPSAGARPKELLKKEERQKKKDWREPRFPCITRAHSKFADAVDSVRTINYSITFGSPNSFRVVPNCTCSVPRRTPPIFQADNLQGVCISRIWYSSSSSSLGRRLQRRVPWLIDSLAADQILRPLFLQYISQNSTFPFLGGVGDAVHNHQAE